MCSMATPGGFDEGGLHGLGFSDEAHHESVVVRVRGIVEQAAAFGLPEGLHNGFDDVCPFAFAVVRDALDQLSGHFVSLPPVFFFYN